MYKMEKKNNTILLGLVIVGTIFFLIFSGLVIPQKFVILDDDFTHLSTINFTVGQQPLIDPQNGMVMFLLNSISTANITSESTLNFTYINNSYSGPSGKVYYAVDVNKSNASSLFLYDTIPVLPDGYHDVGKIKLTIINATTVKYEDWSLNTLINNQIINVASNVTSKQLCEAVSGNYTNVTCTCPNGDKWMDNSTSKKCGAITKTVEKEVDIQPTFFQKYGIALVVIIVAGIILYTKRKKKK